MENLRLREFPLLVVLAVQCMSFAWEIARDSE